MKQYLYVALVAAFLLFAGCVIPIGGGSSQGKSEGAATLPPLPSDQPSVAPNESAAAAPVEEAPAPEPAAPSPALSAEKCTVEFMKDDVSNLFYVMVKTQSTKELSVTCPNGEQGKRQNGLFFCSQLDSASPATAYLSGLECGSAKFMAANTNKPPTGKSSCSIVAAPSRIKVGDTTVISVKVYAPEKTALSYQCGTDDISSSANGMVDLSKICRYNTAGTFEVGVKLNGNTCATTSLVVFEKAKDCAVLESGFSLQKGELVYSAKVAARGYSGSDAITYKCDGIPKEIRLNTLSSAADFTTAIECRTKSALASDIPVKIGGDECGSMLVGQ